MTRIIKIVSIFAIIIGVVGVALNTILGVGSISYIDEVNVGSLKFYQINTKNYLDNLKITAGSPQDMLLNLPTLSWSSNVIDNLKVIANLLIFPINIIFYPIKVSAYLSRALLGLVGLDFINPTNTTAWLVNLINQLTALQIPYFQ